MKANLPNREPQMLQQWQKENLYQQIRDFAKGKPKFILHDGPPYANGDIHLGHSVNKVLKDIIIKSRGFEGFDAPYVPGWDCHGLPIELQVEKKVGKAGGKVDAKTFRKACREYAGKQVEKQKKDFIRLGVFGDWDKPYLTMNTKTEADIVRALGKIISNGHLLKGSKPVHWCADCGSALAEAEVEYENKRSPAIDVRFEILDDEALMQRCRHVGQPEGSGPLSIVIWTTTPWTLPANEAVCVHPKLEYAVVQLSGNHGAERLLIAEELISSAMQRYGFEEHQVIAYCQGSELENLKVRHPFLDKEVPIILGNHVTTDAGTGAVHTAPAHGQDDYVVGSQYGLPVDNPVGPSGHFLDKVEHFAGKHVFAANDDVIALLKQHNALVHHQALDHSYPHCWRHKTPIIFRATPQWFISMDQKGLRQTALANIQDVSWIPNWGQARIQSMIENRPDWCISRQRTWGVPITLFVHKETQEPHPRSVELIEAVARKMETVGIDAWFDLDPQEILGDEAEQYQKVTDTLDVWFDSGVTHFSVLSQRDELQYPADLYLEGSDQHRGWFQSSLVSAVAMNGNAPYKACLTHGFTVDVHGRKMSKSLGNGIEPQEIFKTMGADILRLWIAATDYRGEMTVSDEIFKRTADAYRRFRNTARFLLANIGDFDPAQQLVSTENMLSLDRWAIERASRLQEEIRQAYDRYEFHLIYQKVLNFCTVDMGGFYLDVIKDRQYTSRSDSLERRSTQSAIYHIINAYTRWLAPILSFTAEEIHSQLPGDKSASIFLNEWYQLPTVAENALGYEQWNLIIELREHISKELEKLRVAGEIGSSLDAELDLYCGSELRNVLRLLGDELHFVLITSRARIHDDTGHGDEDVHITLSSNDEFWVRATASAHDKCTRCWHHDEGVGKSDTHPELCPRCISNVDGDGFARRFA